MKSRHTAASSVAIAIAIAIAVALLACESITEEEVLDEFGGDGAEGCTAAEPPQDVSPSDKGDFCLDVSVESLRGLSDGYPEELDRLSGEILLNRECLGVSAPEGLSFVVGVALRADETGTDYAQEIVVPLAGDAERVVEQANVQPGTTLLVAKVTEFQGDRLLKLVNIATLREEAGVKYIETLTGPASASMSAAMKVDGPGLYGMYLATSPVGFVSGTVELDGAPAPGALVIGTSAPFIAFAGDDGGFTIANVQGQGGLAGYDLATRATGEVFLPVVEDGIENPKTGEPAESPAAEQPIEDVDALNLTGVVLRLERPDPAGADEPNLDFEAGDLTGWAEGGDVAVLTTDSGRLFDAEGAHYAFVSSGDGALGGARSAVIREIAVPEGKTTLKVEYSFVSQEYPAWLDSIFNDIFVVFVAGQSRFLHKETVQSNKADWEDYFAALGNVGESIAEGGDVGGRFGGLVGPRTASFDLKACRGQRIRLVFAVSDIGDSIYDSAALINGVWFE